MQLAGVVIVAVPPALAPLPIGTAVAVAVVVVVVVVPLLAQWRLVRGRASNAGRDEAAAPCRIARGVRGADDGG